jgi:hypothetical protein
MGCLGSLRELGEGESLGLNRGKHDELSRRMKRCSMMEKVRKG